MNGDHLSRTVGVLGATGAVGQRFVLLLANHPHFKVTTLGSSPRSAGKKYKDAANWKQAQPLPEKTGSLVVQECVPSQFKECDIVFSGLDSDVAGKIEADFRNADIPVFSNAKNYRQDALVPLVAPTVNLNHLDMVKHQQKTLFGKGIIVCNSNCAVVNIVVPFAALQEKFGPIEACSVVTMQAVSGAGYPGVSSMDIMDNVVPFISGEEDKLEPEARKMLGSWSSASSTFEEHALKISASCNRVPVLNGHTASVDLRFQKRPPPGIEDVKAVMRDYVSDAQRLGCASAPRQAIIVRDESDRPQPRLDIDAEGGFAVSVGRVREDPSGMWDLKFVSVSHNTIIGAAGASILNAEAAVLKGLA